MEKEKDYKSMTVEEQIEWITDFSKFKEEKLPTLCALGDAWESSHVKDMEEGLKLFRAFAICRDFVDSSLMYRDFSRRMDRMMFYIGKIEKEISAGTVVKGKNGETLAYVPSVQPTSRRRGRPTKAESETSANSSDELALEEEKAKAIAKLTGSTIVAPQPAASEQAPKKEDTKSTQPDLFSAAVTASVGEGRLHIDQIAWLLSPALREETKHIQGYRALAAKESEQAKDLANNGVDKAVIEPHARAASENKNKELGIYAEIDRELATLYILLGIDENYGGYKAEMEKKNFTLDQLKAILLPYFEKKCKEEGWEEATRKELAAQPAETNNPQTAGNDTQQGGEKKPELSEAELAARSKALHRCRTYMLRTDQKLTVKRLEKMRDIVKEVESLGEDTTEYQVILTKAETDFEAANNPAQTEEAKASEEIKSPEKTKETEE